MAIRGGAVLDGTEIAALLISKRSSVLKVADVILILNVLIFSAAYFLAIESALYSILTYFAASKTIGFLLYGIEEHHAVVIVSDRHELIRDIIVNNLGRSVTIYKGQSGTTDTERDILYIVVTRLEIGEVKNAALQLDKNAFIIVHNLSDVEGGLVKRNELH